ncbi:hypothetical protein EI94DRAFT_1829598 [Lactarius quietus]|nr:hypothetical protein EI94DRAFT_1829598 [Lactarius quietus]
MSPPHSIFIPVIITSASQLDPTTITDEITRLQNSLRHLKRTQDELRAYSDGPELALALRENDAVIASQEERIYMLNMALIENGVISSSGHYEPTQPALLLLSTSSSRELPRLHEGRLWMIWARSQATMEGSCSNHSCLTV